MHYNYLKVGIILELAYTQSQVSVTTTFCLKIFYKDKHICAQSTFIHENEKKSGFSVMKSPIYPSGFNTHPKRSSGIDIKI